MNILKSIFKRKSENRANRSSMPAGAGYRFFFGQSVSGATVNERTAMQMTAVYACVRVLAESVASLPLHLYRRGGTSENREKAEEHPLFFLLHDEPNPEMTSYMFRETLMTHLLLFGNAYAQILRNGKGEVLGLYPLMPNRMSVERDENGKLFYRYYRYNEAIKEKHNQYLLLTPQDVLRIPGLSYDGLVGFSPIAACRNAVGAGLAAENYSGRYFANGAAPMGVLEHPGLIKNPSLLRESWNAAYGGTQNAGKVAILEEGMKFTPISVSPQDAQLLETRKFTVEEICRIFRVPPHLVQDLERATFNNIEQMSIDFVMYSLMPWLVRWEQSMSKALLSREEKKRYEIRFNVDGLLRGSHKERYEAYAVGINNGFMCPNDVRRLENMDVIPNGDIFMVQGAMMPLDMVGAAYTSDTLDKPSHDRNDTIGGDNRNDSKK